MSIKYRMSEAVLRKIVSNILYCFNIAIYVYCSLKYKCAGQCIGFTEVNVLHMAEDIQDIQLKFVLFTSTSISGFKSNQ